MFFKSLEFGQNLTELLERSKGMEVVAQTRDGVLISATVREVKEILKGVLGSDIKEVCIGQKIPAIDYMATIKKIKGLAKNYEFTNLVSRVTEFSGYVYSLKAAVEDAASIEVE
jgi:hypothetical protein